MVIVANFSEILFTFPKVYKRFVQGILFIHLKCYLFRLASFHGYSDSFSDFSDISVWKNRVCSIKILWTQCNKNSSVYTVRSKKLTHMQILHCSNHSWRFPAPNVTCFQYISICVFESRGLVTARLRLMQDLWTLFRIVCI